MKRIIVHGAECHVHDRWLEWLSQRDLVHRLLSHFRKNHITWLSIDLSNSGECVINIHLTSAASPWNMDDRFKIARKTYDTICRLMEKSATNNFYTTHSVSDHGGSWKSYHNYVHADIDSHTVRVTFLSEEDYHGEE